MSSRSIVILITLLLLGAFGVFGYVIYSERPLEITIRGSSESLLKNDQVSNNAPEYEVFKKKCESTGGKFYDDCAVRFAEFCSNGYVVADRQLACDCPDTYDWTQTGCTAEPIDKVTSWATYRNDIYGYEISYPNDWKMPQIDGDTLYILAGFWRDQPEGGSGVSISVWGETLQEFIDEYNASDISYGVPLSSITNQEPYTIDGIEATKLTASTAIGLPATYIFIPYGKSAYIIYYAEYDDLLVDIVSTFKFTGPAAWKTYRNEELGFEFQYPSESDFKLYDGAMDQEKISLTSYIPACDAAVSAVCLVVPQNAYPQTNFGSAGFSVNIIASANSETACVSLADRGVTDKLVESRIMSGMIFWYGIKGGAALGHSALDHLYRTWRNGRCIELDLRVSQSSFQNYDPSLGIKEFTQKDEAAVWGRLQEVLDTISFGDVAIHSN